MHASCKKACARLRAYSALRTTRGTASRARAPSSTPLVPSSAARPRSGSRSPACANGEQFLYGEFAGPQSYRDYNQSQLVPKKSPEDPIQVGYFFESPSKYVSLKKFQSVFEQPDPDQRYQQVVRNAREWLEKLSVQEKSVVLSVVDKQLVGLIYSMFKVYQAEGNVKFTNRRISPEEASSYHRVKHYNLLYQDTRLGHNSQRHSNLLQRYQQAEDALISAVRLLNLTEAEPTKGEVSKKKGKSGKSVAEPKGLSQVGGQNFIKQFDTITVDLEFYKNYSYFLEIMKMASSHQPFLFCDNPTFCKDPKRLENSIFYSDGAVHSAMPEMYQTKVGQDIYFRQSQDLELSAGRKRIQEIPQTYNTYVSRYDPTSQAPRYDQHHQMDRNQSHFTLAQCLCTIFERAVNVQYQDYLNKLERHQLYFFLGDKALLTNVFSNDQLIIKYWTQLPQPQREQAFKHLDEIERQMRQEEHNPLKMLVCSRISESVQEDDEETGGKVVLKSAVGSSARERMGRIFGEDDEDWQEEQQEPFTGRSLYNQIYQRQSRGIASSNMVLRSESDDSGEEVDLESQTKFARTTNAGIGAVGKLQNLKKAKTTTKSAFYMRRNESLQDEDDEEYSQDNFENYSDHDERSTRDRVIDSLENPLLTHNKFFFVRKQLGRFLQQGHPDYSSRDIIKGKAIEFVKCLSTSVSLAMVAAASAMNTSTSFSSISYEESYVSSETTLSALSIPIKQRFYEYLLKLEEKKRWDDLLLTDAPDQGPTAPTAQAKPQPPPKSNQGSDTQKTSSTEQTPSTNTKNKKKKKKNKDKAGKKAEQAESQPSTVVKQLREEIESIDLVKTLIAKEEWGDSCELKLNQISLQEQILQERRHREERTSLLGGEYLPHKYLDEEEEPLGAAFRQDPSWAATDDVEMQDVSEQAGQGGEAPKEAQAPQQQQKKKKRKKNKKNKKKATAPQSPPIQVTELVSPQIRTITQIENIVELLGIEVSEEVKAEILSVKAFEQEIGVLIDEYIMVEELSSNIIQKTIEAAKVEDEPTPLPPIKEETQPTKKQKKGKKQAPPPPVAKPPKLSKKQAKAAKKAQQLKQQEEAKAAQVVAEEIIPEEIEACASEEEECFELNDANLQLFDKQQEERAETPERSKKSVGFRMAATTPRQQHHLSSSGDDEVKIPKRGSSRGSSCIEDANHQSTISMLGDLFPQQYKNPSDDTKLRINKITSSSSGSSPETSAKPGPSAAPVSKFLEDVPLEPVTKKRRNQRDRKAARVPETAPTKEEGMISVKAEEAEATEEAKAEEVGKGKKKMATIKEMKERGAIARPSDIEQAKKAKKQKDTTLAPVTVPRTQTPTVGGAQPQTEPLLPKTARPKPIAKQATAKTQPAQPQPQQAKRKGAPVRPPAPQGPFFDEQAMQAFLAQQQQLQQQQAFLPYPGNMFMPPPFQSYFPPPDFAQYQQTSFQTPQETPEKSTQTDETRIEQQQQPPVVMNQYQNIQVQLQMPPQNPFLFPGAYGLDMAFPQHIFPFGNMPFPGQPNGMPTQPIGHFPYPSQTGNPILDQYIQQNLINSQYSMLGLVPPSQPGAQQQQQPQFPQFNQPSPMTLPQHTPYNRMPQNLLYQPNMLQSLINELTLQSIPRHRQASQDESSIVSHMTEEQHQQQLQVQEREDRFYSKLDQEIYKLQNKLKMKVASIEAERQIALRKVEQAVRDTYSEAPHVQVQMYGSMATGLAIDSSDMDLLVSGVFQLDQAQAAKLMAYPGAPLVVDRVSMVEQMKRLYRELTNADSQSTLRDFLESVQIIETASVPVIKLVIDLQKVRDAEGKQGKPEVESEVRQLKVDITFNDDLASYRGLHMGLKCCGFIKHKLEEFPILEPLALVLKKFLALRNLNSPFLGGLNSYGLIILIVAFLNQDWTEIYKRDGAVSSGKALKSFLYYFGKLFDPNVSMVNELQQVVPHMNFASILIIQDPLNPANNIGKSTFNFDAIRQQFASAYDGLYSHLQEFVQASLEEPEQDDKQQKVVYQKKLDILGKLLASQSSE